MSNYIFTLELAASGDTPEEAWEHILSEFLDWSKSDELPEYRIEEDEDGEEGGGPEASGSPEAV